MSNEQLLATAVATPLVGALILPALGRVGAVARQAVALALALVPLACSALLLPSIRAGAAPVVAVAGVGLLQADLLAVFMALSASLLGAIIVVYSFGYLDRPEHQGEYYLMVVLFLGAMMALVYARNLVVLYTAWEITAVACWRLIGFFREPAYVARADKAFLITGFGAVCMLLGFVVLHAQAGTLDLAALRGVPASNLAVGLIVCGILSKSATLPLHTWLPDAGVAPSPVTALLHAAVLVKIGVYVFARLFDATLVIEPVWREFLPWLAGASALVAGSAALLEHDLKRVIAYSTVSQLGFILLGFALGGERAAGGALLFILVHAIAKGGLFLCAGIVEHTAHTKDLRQLGGLAKRLPGTAAAFALCAFSVMGLPPFGGFFAKHLVLGGAFEAGRPGLALVFVAGSLLTVLYLGRVFAAVFLGKAGPAVAALDRAHGDHAHGPAGGARIMVGAVSLLAALSLASGLLVKFPAELAEEAARGMVQPAAPAAQPAQAAVDGAGR